MNPSRRRFLRNSLLALLTGGSLQACLTGADGKPDALAPAKRSPDWLRKITGDPESVARLGAAYIAAHPGEDDLDRLLGEIEIAMMPSLDGKKVQSMDDDAIVASLIDTVQQEYVKGDIVSVGVWVLSQTEARLYAAASLLSKRQVGAA